jgi:transposase
LIAVLSTNAINVKKEWNIRKDSILEDLKVPFSKFILTVKLFIFEVLASKAHKELEFMYNFRDNIEDNLYKCLGGIN